ncbi:D-alanyl-D-alanine-carboxypeptidase/endopeptidase AmpH precursor [Stieleria neptunia]|uniref:D-alanyl-D-alanine-carboxypeptidase/endopeptidase AmpH n=1 Tax=Stieleria neptunia TaxID=2527979 RepID=A0A518HM84_9BACT|nr:serine hydrolase domain-containing protein [Stieleria neptunia]QDV41930.1 D-alanyl-D-alanine-carboxypeptidase/endopeptidase AmpH precursor [Stieleria neptunia]
MTRIATFFLLTIGLIPPAVSTAQQADSKLHGQIEALIEAAIGDGDLPGAVVCVADGKQVRYLQTFGDRQMEPNVLPMTTDTVFDLASITKPVATATSIALLSQRGQIDLNAPVSIYLPEFTGHKKETITVAQCLLHVSGLMPDNALADYQDGPETAWRRICDLTLRSDPGTKFAYSDVGFIVLGKLVEKVSGQPLDVFAKENVFRAMGMQETTFNPPAQLKARAAPTEKQSDGWLRGQVHDPRASRLGGVAGHAGLFSTANDLVTFGQNLLAASHGNSSVLERETFDRMTAPHDVPAGNPRGTRTLGWDHQSPYSSNRGTALSDSAFGHGGFTGTVLWIDPQKDLIFIFLSSRLHPDGKGSVNHLAGEIVTLVAAASR